jgi:hypothetical protein
MAEVFKARGVTLPSPTAVTINDELIWTAETGRLYNGAMFGSVIAQKKTVSLTWEYLTAAEMLLIKNNCTGGFFSFTFVDDGTTQSITVYRGTLVKERLAPTGDGIVRYKKVTVDLIQQ